MDKPHKRIKNMNLFSQFSRAFLDVAHLEMNQLEKTIREDLSNTSDDENIKILNDALSSCLNTSKLIAEAIEEYKDSETIQH
jgi:hypothetical protein